MWVAFLVKANINRLKKDFKLGPFHKIDDKKDISDIQLYALKLAEKRFDYQLHINIIKVKMSAYKGQHSELNSLKIEI
jgi:hypothetical protein